jgi:hypothetical protein
MMYGDNRNFHILSTPIEIYKTFRSLSLSLNEAVSIDSVHDRTINELEQLVE